MSRMSRSFFLSTWSSELVLSKVLIFIRTVDGTETSRIRSTVRVVENWVAIGSGSNYNGNGVKFWSVG